MERPVRVLIADDRSTTRRGLRALLTHLPQIEVIGEAADGRESVAMVEKHRPDVVLMDIQMPVMDGVEATRRIKEQWPTVRIIALTIHAGCRTEALAAGADVFLLKEGDSDALLGAVLARPGNRVHSRQNAPSTGRQVVGV